MENIQELFQSFTDLRIGVVGDVMLDTYLWGDVDRVSPEAPVPIVAMRKKDHRIGGAGNVALNLQSLGAKAFLISVMGKDEEAELLTRLSKEQSIDLSYSLQSEARITTNKTRIISRNQQMLRLDAEITTDLTEKDEMQILSRFNNFVTNEKPHLVVLEDYNKGVLTESFISGIIAICNKNKVLTAVDPKRKNFFAFQGVDIFKPNLREVIEALNLLQANANLPELKYIDQQLRSSLRHRVSFITLSDRGVFYQDESSAAIIPSHLRNIADVSGAGDTVIAVASLVYAATGNVHLMAEVANIAGGLVCEEVGTVTINRDKLMHECELLLS